ncbi:MAG: YcaO-like family protein [Rhodocyclaceae bacterium]|nr:YcaO-like family protein [Rhodocyclaceae bacterium]
MSVDLAREVEALSSRLKGITGLLHTISRIRSGPGQPRIHNVSCLRATMEDVLGAEVPGATGAAGFTFEEAVLGAIGESVERYCGAAMDRNRLILATQDELGSDAVGMDSFPHYEEWQYNQPSFQIARWSPSRPMWWREGKSLITGQPRYVPAALVYVPYQLDPAMKREDLVVIPTSTGQACHSDRDLAVLSALCECVERDAFMICWTRSLPVPRVSFLDDSILAAEHERFYAGCNVEFRVVDLTLDLQVPTFACIARGQSPLGVMNVLGCATRPSPRKAVGKAILEAAQSLAWARFLLETRSDWHPAPDWSNVIDFEDHVLLHARPFMSHHLDHWFNAPNQVPLPPEPPAGETTRQAIDRMIAGIASAGLDAIIVDLTTRDIADIGLFVPKVLVTHTAPLTSNHLIPALATNRYWSAPEASGRFSGPLPTQINKIPHPFP